MNIFDDYGFCCTGTNTEQSVDDALTYLIFLVDVNKLYKAALAMYDVCLALAVAQRSQMVRHERPNDH